MLVNGRAKRAEVYPGLLCKEILIGLQRQMRKDGRLTGGGDLGIVIAVEEKVDGHEQQVQQAWDDVTGKELRAERVREAREEEMEEVRKHRVYIKVPISECLKKTGKMPVGVRWVDINKGDEIHEEYRSRLVAMEKLSG